MQAWRKAGSFWMRVTPSRRRFCCSPARATKLSWAGPRCGRCTFSAEKSRAGCRQVPHRCGPARALQQRRRGQELERPSDAGVIRCSRSGIELTEEGRGCRFAQERSRRARRGNTAQHQIVLQRHDRLRSACIHPSGLPLRCGWITERARKCRRCDRGWADRPGGKGEDHHGARRHVAAP